MRCQRLSDVEARAKLGHETSLTLDSELKAQRSKYEASMEDLRARLKAHEAVGAAGGAAFSSAQAAVRDLAHRLLLSGNNNGSGKKGRRRRRQQQQQQQQRSSTGDSAGSPLLPSPSSPSPTPSPASPPLHGDRWERDHEGMLCVSSLLAIELNAAQSAARRRRGRGRRRQQQQ